MASIDSGLAIQDADAASGLVHDLLFRADPIWSTIRFNMAALVAQINNVQSQYNSLVNQLITDSVSGVTSAMLSNAPQSGL